MRTGKNQVSAQVVLMAIQALDGHRRPRKLRVSAGASSAGHGKPRIEQPTGVLRFTHRMNEHSEGRLRKRKRFHQNHLRRQAGNRFIATEVATAQPEATSTRLSLSGTLYRSRQQKVLPLTEDRGAAFQGEQGAGVAPGQTRASHDQDCHVEAGRSALLCTRPEQVTSCRRLITEAWTKAKLPPFWRTPLTDWLPTPHRLARRRLAVRPARRRPGRKRFLPRPSRPQANCDFSRQAPPFRIREAAAAPADKAPRPPAQREARLSARSAWFPLA